VLDVVDVVDAVDVVVAPGQFPGYPLVGTAYPREGQKVFDTGVVVEVVHGSPDAPPS
jgi:hypothetical protein